MTRGNHLYVSNRDMSAVHLSPASQETGGISVSGFISGSAFTSLVFTGTQPYACSSQTLNTNLNADMVDGLHAASFLSGLKILHGAITLVAVTAGGQSTTITFSPSFVTSPHMAVTLGMNPGTANTWALECWCTSVTTTGATIGWSANSSISLGGVTLHWIAVGT